MSLPGFNEPFHEYYDQYSISVDNFSIPGHFDIFVPDNQDDYNCVAVISPSRDKGAVQWTIHGKCITIGIYRDEGRATSRAPARTGLTWSREAKVITIVDTKKHRLKVGDEIDVFNINVDSMYKVEVETIIDEYSFSFIGYFLGAIYGIDGAYQKVEPINFYETHRVFRLLPSFKLLTIAELNEIFSASAPVANTSLRTMYDITKNKSVPIPSGKTSVVNYDLPSKATGKDILLQLERRFGQIYDESGIPLKLKYLDNGEVKPDDNVDSKYKNEHRYLNNSNGDTSRVYVYDFYGIDLNDQSRGPYHSNKIVSRDETADSNIGNIKLLLVNDEEVYTGKIHDEFGNLVIGVQDNNAVIVRRQILPLALNNFNQPVKSPLRK